MAATTPVRPPNLPHGRWLGDFHPLRPLERALVEACRTGTPLHHGTAVPTESTADNSVRGGLVRFLVLGGDDHHPVHEEGVVARGLWVDGDIQLHQAACAARLRLADCAVPSTLILMAATISELSLRGTHLGALRADRLRVHGSVFLSDGFQSTGDIRLLGASIGGTFNCRAGRFGATDKAVAINGDRLHVGGNIVLSNDFHATGRVRMLGSRVGGSVHCSGGTFINPAGTALDFDQAVVQGGLFLRGATIRGTLVLSAASVKRLIDASAVYEEAKLILDGFQYEGLTGPTRADIRRQWLSRQTSSHLGDDFRPQPWEQLAAVLRQAGHMAEAAEIAMAKQAALRAAGKIGQRLPNDRLSPPWRWCSRHWAALANRAARSFHWLYGALAGYGHRPSRLVLWMLAVAAVCSCAYYGGRENGLIAPASPLIHLNPALEACGTGGDPGKLYWTDARCPVPPEYSTFQPFFYALDVMLPLIDLHQEADWAPVVSNAAGKTLWAGRGLRWLMWFEILFGWVASLMFVAIVGRLVEKD